MPQVNEDYGYHRLYLDEWESSVLAIWLDAMSARGVGKDGARYARLYGKVIDAPYVKPYRVERFGSSARKKREYERQMKIMEANPSEVERHTIERRKDFGLCPIHGCELVATPIEHVIERPQKKCPDIGCDYRKPTV